MKKLFTTSGYDALYTGKPIIAELILALKQVREELEPLNSLQVFVGRDDEAFANMLRTLQFVEQPTPPEVDRLFVRVFIVPKPAPPDIVTGKVAKDGTQVGQRSVPTFAAPVGPVPVNDPRIRRLHR